MNSFKPKFILTGGGTAGHVIPNLALIPYLKDRYELHYVGSKGGIEEKLSLNAGIPFHAVECVKYRRGGGLKNLCVPFKLLKAKSAAKKLLKQLNPVGIFSKGGYAALPLCLAAKNTPVFLHESDFTLGLANKLCIKKTRLAFFSFPAPAREHNNGVFSGALIRRELYLGNADRAAAECGFKTDLPRLLIIGGSSGSHAINECVYSSIDELTKTFNVIHITGSINRESNIVNPRYYSVSYTNNIADFFAYSDVVVTRGGSGVLFELAALKKPMLVIPLPKDASRGDQILNAEYFHSMGYAALLNQHEMNSITLPQAVIDLYRHRGEYIEAMRAAQPDGTKKIADAVLSVLDNK